MQDILTEKEARMRRCPYSFGPPWTVSGLKVPNVGTTETVQTSPTNCIASECMGWRAAHLQSPNGEERGYCGAFGTPRFT